MDISTCLKRYITRVDDITNKPIKNICNYGLLPFETAKVMRNGEYHGVEIHAIDMIYPLFTTQNITKVYELLLRDDYNTIIQILKIDEEYNLFGNDVVHYIIRKWCDTTHVICPDNVNDVNLRCEKLDDRIARNRSDSIFGRFKIINIGRNTNSGHSVVPEDWIDREFTSGKEMHLEMDKLDYRKGSPPVTYCCTYGMGITSDSDVKQWEDFNKISKSSIKKLNIKCFLKINKYKKKDKWGIKSELVNVFSADKTDKKYKVVFPPKSEKCACMLILVESGIFITNNTKQFLSKENTSYLSSLLQKCFRTRNDGNLIQKTINDLHYSAGYNLPDQHFARVSGCRQLCWRSFISIIEDVSPFLINNEYNVDLLDLFALAYISHIDPNALLHKNVIDQIQMSVVKCQSNTICWDWRKGSHVFNNISYNEISKNIIVGDKNNRNKNSLILAMILMPMMRNDFIMLSKGYDYLDTFKLEYLDDIYNNNVGSLSNDDMEHEVKMTAMDMHCFPFLLIQLQGCIPFFPVNNKKTYSLQKLGSFIWECSSGLNIRYRQIPKITTKGDLEVLKALHDIQYSYINTFEASLTNLWDKYFDNNGIICNTKNENYRNASRIAFLLVFGKKYKLVKKIKNKQYDIIICGNKQKPCKVKKTIDRTKMMYVDGNERYLAEKEFISNFKDTINLKYLSPPIGYKWKNSNIKYNISAKITKDIPEENIHEINFYVNNTKITPFDGSCLIEKIEMPYVYNVPHILDELLNVIFYNDIGNVYDTLMELFTISKIRFIKNDTRIFNWEEIIDIQNVKIMTAFMYARSRIIMARDVLQIGPVDRSGNRTHNGISYIYEGIIWRFIICLSALYPDTIKPLSPYKFKIITSTCGYMHLINTLNNLCKINVQKITKSTPTLTTKLWNHQEQSIDKIMNGIIEYGKKGFGDASDVGSGKTLTSLGTMIKIIKYANKINILTHGGFLVLLPTEKLFETWITEINKHTKGFDILTQQADGSLIKMTNNVNDDIYNTIDTNKINNNTIIITTMGRCRDHPIIYPWLLVIIDECLTVQNKEALQTEEAWRQSSYSYFGVIMLSATFFRSRFEKMLYMLCMLNTGLPETSEYLDTILSESIVCNLSETSRKWITNINWHCLSKINQDTYDKIAVKHTEVGFEKVYHMLDKFLRENENHVMLFDNAITKIINQRINSKILIYANSKEEADNISQINNVGRYPNISKKHTVVSYAEGTYGLNNLVCFNTILTKIPESDKLPQMKGRLDRPGQLHDILYLEYIIIKNTIEDAKLYKLEIANNFYGNHIMPLAEYYKLAIMHDK
jgi:hypothetical protein